MKKPDIESGANKRTRSNVWFGEPTHASNFYDTTTNTTFTPYDVKHDILTHGNNYQSNIPTDYYSKYIII